jgi:hypothetical protein
MTCLLHPLFYEEFFLFLFKTENLQYLPLGEARRSIQQSTNNSSTILHRAAVELRAQAEKHTPPIRKRL